METDTYDPAHDPEMQALFRQARAEGLWFYTSYQGLWFSPDQLADAQANRRFRWGAVNWQLRDPHERLEEARRDYAQAAQRLAVLETQIKGMTS